MVVKNRAVIKTPAMTRNGTITIRTEGERLGMVRKGAIATSMMGEGRCRLEYPARDCLLAPPCSPCSFRVPLRRYCRYNLAALGGA